MDVKKAALLIGALFVAALTAIMAKNLFSGASTTQAMASAPVQAGPDVLVATRSLPVGTIIDPSAFRFQPWPKDLVQSAYFIKGQSDPASMSGTVVRYAITAGQPITQGALVKPGDRGFLAAALGPGLRAVTVAVSAASSVAGFVFPGDRIDLVLTQTVSGDGPPLNASETIVRNLRVLATDQRTATTTDEGKADVRTFSTVTLEATPRIAEKIAVAQTIGQLSLSLRSIADSTAELERAIAAGEVTIPDVQDPNADRQMLLAIASRPIDTNTTFVTGADVSRFQRRNMPRQSSGNSAPPASSAPMTDAQPFYQGPVVRVARGNNVTAIPVGGK